jgi:mediator of RNA polymerase II transcription subunit 5
MTLSKWPLFLRQCLFQRTSGEEFADLLAQVYERNKISGLSLIRLVLKCNSNFCAPNDYLIPVYLQKIVSLALADVSDLLIVLIKQWNEFTKTEEDQPTDLKDIEESASLVNCLIGMIATGSFTLSTKEARRSLLLCARWFASVSAWVSKDPSRASESSAMALVESCGLLLVALASSTAGNTVLDNSKSSVGSEQAEPTATIQKSILSSLPLLPTASQSLHLRLEAVLRHVSQPRASDKPGASDQDALHFQSGVVDGPSLASRASLYLYLDALRSRCATIDDSRLLSFLNARYSTDYAAMFNDLIVASFDVLQRAHSRQRVRQSLDRWCSFIVHKLPTLLSVISASSFGSFSTEDALKNVLQYVNSDFSSPFLTTNLSIVRKRFVQVCALYRLLPMSNVSLVVGTPEADLSHSPVLHTKEDLVNQMRSNVSNGSKLLKDIRKLDGNAVNIASAVVEVIHGYSQSKETLLLKELATVMLRQPEIIDVVSLYVQPGYFVAPLCQLLDEWTWDDLHGEGQPLYEEFGSILLLIMAFKYRLSLSDLDMGLSNDSPFVLSFLRGTHDEQYMETMTDDTKKHLGEWINALFIAEGLSDEVMSSCSPQDFYRLVPTLLSQSLIMCENRNKLSAISMMSGFEYFSESFLLPSLIPAIIWLISPAAARHKQEYVQQILEILLKKPTSEDAKEIHRTILGIAAAISSRTKSTPEILQLHTDFISNVGADMQETKSWVAVPGGLLSQASEIIRALLSWSSANTSLMSPPTSGYTQLVAATGVYDPKVLLEQFLKILTTYYNTHDHAAALDLLATAIISLDEACPTKRLADALAAQQGDLLPLLKKNETLLAEEIVRLSRRVELLSVVVVVQQDIPMDDVVTTLMPELTEADMQNVAAFPEQNGGSATQEDGPQDIDSMLDAAAAMGGMGQDGGGNMDDLYNLDLDAGDMDLINFDDMDMEGMF